MKLSKHIKKGISPKVNVIVQLEFELAYYNFTVQLVNHYTMETPNPFSKVLVIHKQAHRGFELGLSIPFPMTIIIILRMPPLRSKCKNI